MPMTNLVLCLLLANAVLALTVRNRFAAVICFAVFSLLCALVFFLLNAPDVAIAEAAVGAGLSTFVFVWAIRKTTGEPEEGGAE